MEQLSEYSSKIVSNEAEDDLSATSHLTKKPNFLANPMFLQCIKSAVLFKNSLLCLKPTHEVLWVLLVLHSALIFRDACVPL